MHYRGGLTYSTICGSVLLFTQMGQAQTMAPTGGTMVDSPTSELSALKTQLQSVDVSPLETSSFDTALSITSATPTGFGGYAGDIAVGGSVFRLANNTDNDGTAYVIAGFGHRGGLGVDASFNILNLTHRNGAGFGDRNSFSVGAHGPVGENLYARLGAEDVAHHNDKGALHGPSYYGVITQRLLLKPSAKESFSRAYISLGLGTNRFRRASQFATDTGHYGFFGSAAISVNKKANLFTEWTGEDASVGASFQPLSNVPLTITPGLSNLTHTASNRTDWFVGASYRFHY